MSRIAPAAFAKRRVLAGREFIWSLTPLCVESDPIVWTEFSRATQPVLVVCGEQDTISGAPGPLAAAFRNGTAVTIARRDHMSAVGDRAIKQAVLDFLAA